MVAVKPNIRFSLPNDHMKKLFLVLVLLTATFSQAEEVATKGSTNTVNFVEELLSKSAIKKVALAIEPPPSPFCLFFAGWSVVVNKRLDPYPSGSDVATHRVAGPVNLFISSDYSNTSIGGNTRPRLAAGLRVNVFKW